MILVFIRSYLIILTMLGVVSAYAVEKQCAALFMSQFETSYNAQTIQLTSERMERLTLQDLEKIEGQLVSVRFFDSTKGMDYTPASRFLSFQRFSPERRNLIRKLIALKQHSKFIKSKAESEISMPKEINQLIADHTAGKNIRIDPSSFHGSTKLQPLDLNKVAHVEIKTATSEVEVGALVLNLKNRAVTAIHTSRAFASIQGKDFAGAFSGVLERTRINLEDVESVEYFHTHPVKLPLSAEDINAAKLIKTLFLENYGKSIPVYMHAIIEIEGAPVVSSHQE